MVLGVPYTGILEKKHRKTLIPHQRFLKVFDLRIYGGSDPIYGKKVIFDQKSVKNTVFKYFSLGAKFNRFFIILGGVQLDQSYIREADLWIHRESIIDREGLGFIFKLF